MSRPPSTWKTVERAVARILGGERVGPSGKATADVASARLVVEVKHRRALPNWLKDALAQAEAAADGRLPVAVIHEHRQRYDDALVVLRLADFVALLAASDDSSAP